MATMRQPRSDPRSSSNARISNIRLAICLTGAVALAWFVFAISLAGFARSNNPQLAATAAPFDAVAKGERAYAIIEADNSPAARQQAWAMGTEAVLRDPTAVGAVRTLGLVADLEGRREQAAQLFAYSESLSRRDFPTQLWMIEARVAADDAKGALVHFFRALRTSRLAEGALMPILIGAIDDPRLVEPMAVMLASQPPWRTKYLTRLRMESKAFANTAALAERIANPAELAEFSMVFAGNLQFDLAARMFLRAGRRLEAGSTGFENIDGFHPFDWQLVSAGPVLTTPISIDGSQKGIEFRVSSETGEIAHKLLGLRPGRYIVSSDGRLDTGSKARLAATITCAQPIAPLVEVPFQGAVSNGAFTVPARDCSFQWIRIVVSNNADRAAIAGKIISFVVEPASPQGSPENSRPRR